MNIAYTFESGLFLSKYPDSRYSKFSSLCKIEIADIFLTDHQYQDDRYQWLGMKPGRHTSTEISQCVGEYVLTQWCQNAKACSADSDSK